MPFQFRPDRLRGPGNQRIWIHDRQLHFTGNYRFFGSATTIVERSLFNHLEELRRLPGICCPAWNGYHGLLGRSLEFHVK